MADKSKEKEAPKKNLFTKAVAAAPVVPRDTPVLPPAKAKEEAPPVVEKKVEAAAPQTEKKSAGGAPKAFTAVRHMAPKELTTVNVMGWPSLEFKGNDLHRFATLQDYLPYHKAISGLVDAGKLAWEGDKTPDTSLENQVAVDPMGLKAK